MCLGCSWCRCGNFHELAVMNVWVCSSEFQSAVIPEQPCICRLSPAPLGNWELRKHEISGWMHSNKLSHDKSFDTLEADNMKCAVMLNVSPSF